MSVVERLILRTDGVDAGLRRVETRAQAAGRAFSAGARAAGLLSAAMLAAGAAALRMGQQLADRTNDLTDFASRTGLASDTVAGLRLAAEGSGQSLASMDAVVRGLQRTMAQTGDVRSMDEALRSVSEELRGISDPSERARVAIERLGRSGGQMIQALGDQGLQDFVDRAARFGGSVGPAAAEAAGRWQRAVADLRLVMEPAVDELLNLGASAIEGFTIGLVATKVFAGELRSMLVGELSRIPREIMQSPFGVFMRQLFSDPRALFTGGGFTTAFASAVGAGFGAANAPMDPDEALELALGPGFTDRLSEGWARAVEEARAFAAGMGGSGARGGAAGAALGGDPLAALRSAAGALGGENEGVLAALAAMDAALDANRAKWGEMADAANDASQRAAEAAMQAARMMRDSWGAAFGDILGAAQGFANKNLALHKMLGFAQVAVSTAIGIARAMELGFPAAIPAAISAAANGAAQAAAIASTSLGSSSMSSSSLRQGSTMADAVFAPAGDSGSAQVGGGSTRSREQVIRVRSAGGWASQRDLEDEMGRLGLALRFEGA